MTRDAALVIVACVWLDPCHHKQIRNLLRLNGCDDDCQYLDCISVITICCKWILMFGIIRIGPKPGTSILINLEFLDRHFEFAGTFTLHDVALPFLWLDIRIKNADTNKDSTLRIAPIHRRTVYFQPVFGQWLPMTWDRHPNRIATVLFPFQSFRPGACLHFTADVNRFWRWRLRN